MSTVDTKMKKKKGKSIIKEIPNPRKNVTQRNTVVYKTKGI